MPKYEDYEVGSEILFYGENYNIEVLLPNSISPKELGLSKDVRDLGLAIKSISIYISENNKWCS